MYDLVANNASNGLLVCDAIFFFILIFLFFIPGFISVKIFNMLTVCKKHTIRCFEAGLIFDLLIFILIFSGLLIFKGIYCLSLLCYKLMYISFILKYALAAILIAILLGIVLSIIEKSIHEDKEKNKKCGIWHFWCHDSHHHDDC